MIFCAVLYCSSLFFLAGRPSETGLGCSLGRLPILLCVIAIHLCIDSIYSFDCLEFGVCSPLYMASLVGMLTGYLRISLMRLTWREYDRCHFKASCVHIIIIDGFPVVC